MESEQPRITVYYNNVTVYHCMCACIDDAQLVPFGETPLINTDEGIVITSAPGIQCDTPPPSLDELAARHNTIRVLVLTAMTSDTPNVAYFTPDEFYDHIWVSGVTAMYFVDHLLVDLYNYKSQLNVDKTAAGYVVEALDIIDNLSETMDLVMTARGFDTVRDLVTVGQTAASVIDRVLTHRINNAVAFKIRFDDATRRVVAVNATDVAGWQLLRALRRVEDCEGTILMAYRHHTIREPAALGWDIELMTTAAISPDVLRAVLRLCGFQYGEAAVVTRDDDALRATVWMPLANAAPIMPFIYPQQ